MPDQPPVEDQQEPTELRQDSTAEPDQEPDSLDDQQRATLVRLLRVTYPHPDFPDDPYRRTAEAIENAGGALGDGLDRLNAAAGGAFAGLSDDQATELVRQIADGDFFALVHGTAVVALYDDHQVWELLGYEGPSFDKGGYLHRGFDDLDWLPKPRIEEYSGAPRVEIVGGDQ